LACLQIVEVNGVPQPMAYVEPEVMGYTHEEFL